ncbi:GyrI-like domain-containing protein [Chitinophagaceae bacterium MMS25-I14]
MDKLDLARVHKSYYSAKKEPELLDIPAAQYLSITGKGDPSGIAFSENIQALYATAYAVKFACKAAEMDFVMPKLEGLWWYNEKDYPSLSAADASVKVPRKEWEYRLLIRMPRYVTDKHIQDAQARILSKKELPWTMAVALYKMQEGTCVQVLHTGPYDREPETLTLITKFMEENNLARNGLHHEIYLSDFNKTAPEKLKTILREAVKNT